MDALVVPLRSSGVGVRGDPDYPYFLNVVALRHCILRCPNLGKNRIRVVGPTKGRLRLPDPDSFYKSFHNTPSKAGLAELKRYSLTSSTSPSFTGFP